MPATTKKNSRENITGENEKREHEQQSLEIGAAKGPKQDCVSKPRNVSEYAFRRYREKSGARKEST